jgi:hypothetical protein
MNLESAEVSSPRACRWTYCWCRRLRSGRFLSHCLRCSGRLREPLFCCHPGSSDWIWRHWQHSAPATGRWWQPSRAGFRTIQFNSIWGWDWIELSVERVDLNELINSIIYLKVTKHALHRDIYMEEVLSAISSLILGLKYFFRLILISQTAHRLYNIIFESITFTKYEFFRYGKIHSYSADISGIDNILNVIFERREYSFLRIFHHSKDFPHRINISTQYFSYLSPRSLL